MKDADKEMMMGRWSELSLILVFHSARGRSSRLAKVMSGDVGLLLEGSLVGVSSFKTPKFESPIV